MYQNDRLAFKWFVEISKQDNPTARVHLGACYADEVLVGQDYKSSLYF